MAFEDYWMSETAAPPTGASLRFSGAQTISRAFNPGAVDWTISYWVKRGSLGTSTQLTHNSLTGLTGGTQVGFDANSTLGKTILTYSGAGGAESYLSALLRDPGAWYQVFVSCSQGLNTQTLVVNNVYTTSTAAPGNFTLGSLYFGSYSGGSFFFDGYMSDVFFVQGLALAPTDFGKFDANGVWVPLEFTTAKANVITAGGFGTNGFALRFESQYFNSGTLVWADQSGNGNNFTANWNCQVGANGVGNTDIETDGPQVNANTLNPVYPTSSVVYAQANLYTQVGNAGGVYRNANGTFQLSSGKWYFEVKSFNADGNPNIGVGDVTQPSSVWNSDTTTNSSFWYMSGITGNKINGNGGGVAYGSAFLSPDITSVAVDMDAGKIWWGKNGTWFAGGNPATGAGAAFTNLAGRVLTPAFFGGSVAAPSANAYQLNFGQKPFSYTPPTGFNALEATNLPAATIPDGSTGFQALLAPGASILSTALFAFPNGLWWIKDRANANESQLVDSISGTTAVQRCPGNTIGAYAAPTGNSVAWCWATPASGINVSTGFSITNGTHGLGVTPSFVIDRFNNCYFVSCTPGKVIQLNSSGPETTSTFTVNSTTVSSTAGGPYYSWAQIAGYSSFGSYIGNASADGPFVYTGMKPAFVIVKSITTNDDWILYDNVRNTYNPENLYLRPNKTNAEVTLAGMDFLSNGFKIRVASGNAGSNFNGSGQTYAYMAWAQNPFGGSNVAPVTAR